MANQKMHAVLMERLGIADLLQPAMSNPVRDLWPGQSLKHLGEGRKCRIGEFVLEGPA